MGLRGKRPTVAAGRVGLLCLVLLFLTGLGAPVAASPQGGATVSRLQQLPAASRAPTWTAEQAIAALTDDPVVALPGSPAVFDEQRLTEAIGDSNVKILAVPFAQPDKPTDSRMDDATDEQLDAVLSWASGQDVDLITVVGLKINLGGILEQRPSTVPDLQRIMLRSELTSSLLFSIVYERSGRDAADQAEDRADPEPAVSADPTTIDPIATALAEQKYYAAPGVEAPEGAFEEWQDVEAGHTVRVALLAAPEPGEPFVEQIGRLSARFPDDIVVVATGRWVQMAGPEQRLLDSAVLYGYGAFYDRVAQNDLPLANFVLGSLRRVGELRGGSVSDQEGPQTDDPVSGISPFLPWLFVGTALLAVAGLLVAGQHRKARQVQSARDLRRSRARTTAQLAGLSEQLLQLEGLARNGPSQTVVTRAFERYGTARDILVRDGDLLVARSALDEASELVVRAAAELQVPLAEPDAAAGGIDSTPATGPGAG